MSDQLRYGEEPPNGYRTVPSLPFLEDLWREELEYLVAKVYNGTLSAELREEHASRMKKKYQFDTPLREFVGWAVPRSEFDRHGMQGAGPFAVYVRVMARSGFEARKAVLAALGGDHATSLRNLEEQQRTRGGS